MRLAGALSRPRRGAAVVELALLMPIILMLLLGTWEVGRLIEVNQLLDNAVREGGRQAATGQLTASQVQQVVLQYLQNAGISTTHAVASVSDLTTPGTDPSQAAQLDQLQVSVSIPYSDVRWSTLSLITTSSSQLSASNVWNCLRDQNYPTANTVPAGY